MTRRSRIKAARKAALALTLGGCRSYAGTCRSFSAIYLQDAAEARADRNWGAHSNRVRDAMCNRLDAHINGMRLP